MVEASGTQQLGDLKIGDKVVDKSCGWEHRKGTSDYSGTKVIKPVTWIVVAKDHYGADSGVTLLADEVIGRHTFDNSTHSGHLWQHQGFNHWGYSGMHNATRVCAPGSILQVSTVKKASSTKPFPLYSKTR